MKITLDNWDGSSCKEEIYHVNSSVKLLGILERLDNKKHTLVNLVLSEENYLMIGLFESKYILSKEMAFKCAVKCFTIGCIPQNDLDFVWEKY